MPARRFPPPWTVEETQPCFIVRDSNGQALAFVHFENEPGRRSTAKLLTRDEARRIAAGSCSGLSSRRETRWCKGNDGRENTSRSQLD
jgi:hypothetical protein